jgi:two-component system, OmpR family, sensor kinase
MRLPIRARLTTWYALFLAATLAAVGAFLVLKLRADLRGTIDREVRASSAAIRQSYAQEGTSGFAETSSAALRRGGSDAQVLDPRGRVIAAYGADLASDPMLSDAQRKAALAGKPTLLDANLGDSAQPFRVMAVPVTTRGASALVVVAESLQGVSEAVRKILVLLLIAGPVALAAAGLGGWLLVRNALLPVDRMRKKAEQIGIDHLHERLSSPNPNDELGQLAATLNAMLDRLEEGVTARRRLVADASHELRTPLAAMRAELDVALRNAERTPIERHTLQSVREDVDRMSHTVDNLLTLALADEGRLELQRRPVELDKLARAAATPLQALAAAEGVTLVVTGPPCSTEGDAQRLHQALTNLIENAIKYTAAGGEVTVATWREGSEVGVTVRDNGPGIPARVRARVFDRFFRADPSRSRESGGSGLGLAICYEVATAHGGRIWVQSEEGHGSAFSIALPALAPDLRPQVAVSERQPDHRPGR